MADPKKPTLKQRLSHLWFRLRAKLFGRGMRKRESALELDELKLKLAEDREGFEREYQEPRFCPPPSVPPPPDYVPTETELILQGKDAEEIDRLLLAGRARRDD